MKLCAKFCLKIHCQDKVIKEKRKRKTMHNQQFVIVSWVYLFLITAAAENTLISMGNTFSTSTCFLRI